MPPTPKDSQAKPGVPGGLVRASSGMPGLVSGAESVARLWLACPHLCTAFGLAGLWLCFDFSKVSCLFPWFTHPAPWRPVLALINRGGTCWEWW